MLQCLAYTESMRDSWDQFALTHGTVFHTTAFRRVLLESFGYRCGYHAMTDSGKRICALIPLVIGRNLGLQRVGVSLPFVNYLDICADGDEARRQTLEAIPGIIKKQGLKTAEVRLKDPIFANPGWRVYSGNSTFVLPLLADEATTLAQASSSCRNHVRKTYKNEWFASSFDPGLLPDFYRVYVRRMKQLGSPAPSIGFFANLFRYLPNQTFLLSVLDKATGKVVGGMMLLASPGNSTMYYPFGANLVEYNHQYLNNYMYWEAVRFGLRQRFEFLDLGRSPAGSGTYNFKMQWGAKPEVLHYLFYGTGTEDPGPPDRDKLGFLIEIWKKLPDSITGPIGRELIRYVLP